MGKTVAKKGVGLRSAVWGAHNAEMQSWGRSLIFDLKIKDPSDFGDLFDDLDHNRRSDLFNGNLDLKITL